MSKITTRYPMSSQLIADVAMIGRLVKNLEPERAAMARIYDHLLAQDATLRDAIDSWPQFNAQDHDVSGADMVEWFGGWREQARLALHSPRLVLDCVLQKVRREIVTWE